MDLDKKELRKHIRQLKKQYTIEERQRMSVSVWDKLVRTPEYQQAKIILAYWSMDDEVYTHDFICSHADEKVFLLPCVRGDELDIRYFQGKEALQPGEGYAIPEPVGQLFESYNDIDLILVPGMAFDKEGNRLGRGKGYYDKILKQTSSLKIGICFDFQFLDHIPTEKHDVRMDKVLYSEK